MRACLLMNVKEAKNITEKEIDELRAHKKHNPGKWSMMSLIYDKDIDDRPLAWNKKSWSITNTWIFLLKSMKF